MRAMMGSLQADAGESARSRIAWRLLPFLFLLYVANYLDRTNIAYATLGMKGDLGFSDSVFGTASGIFFIGYFALQIPGALLVERWSARLLLAITLITWGGLTTLSAFVHTPHQLYGARFLLGAAEAGFFPGVIVYLSHWFIYQDRAKAIARFMSAIPIAYILGGPLAGAILGINWLGTLAGVGCFCSKVCRRFFLESSRYSYCPIAQWRRGGLRLTNAIGSVRVSPKNVAQRGTWKRCQSYKR